jgi:hypothetical protein
MNLRIFTGDLMMGLGDRSLANIVTTKAVKFDSGPYIINTKYISIP